MSVAPEDLLTVAVAAASAAAEVATAFVVIVTLSIFLVWTQPGGPDRCRRQIVWPTCRLLCSAVHLGWMLTFETLLFASFFSLTQEFESFPCGVHIRPSRLVPTFLCCC